MTDISLCGAVRLLAAIFGENADRLLEKYGLPTPDKVWIDVACAQCGKLKRYRARDLIWRVNYPQRTGRPVEHFFCTKTCRSTWRGIHCGFRAHPENRKVWRT